MSDQTVAALLKIKDAAEQQGAIVDRVEVRLREHDGHAAVEFTAHLLPKPLSQTTVCIAYLAGGDLA